MQYLSEFRSQWRPLTAATIGMGSGLSLSAYTNSIFGPYLIEAFGWSRADFAMMGVITVVALICIPFVGRMADLYGVRRVAATGIVALPFVFLGYSLMTGPLWQYAALQLFMTIFCVSTTATVYSRLVAGSFSHARGMALAIAACGTAIVGAVGSPLLTNLIETQGWRAGYQAMMVFSIIAGSITLALIPSQKGEVKAAAAKVREPSGAVYKQLWRDRVFWILIIGTFLCTLPNAIANSQLTIVVLEQGLSATTAAFMVSLFAGGVVVGRFAAGLALDRYPTHIVATIGLGLPAAGLLLLASNFNSPTAVGISILLLGLSYGAEGDVCAYLVVKMFGIRIYSTVLGLLTAAIGIATSAGSIMLSVMLRQTDTFAPFLLFAAGAVIIGASMFMLLGRPGVRTAQMTA